MGLVFNGYEIVEYRPEFRDQVVEIQTFMWGPNLETNAAYLEWKYYDNPYVDRPIIYLALHEGRVVGMLGMFDTCWQVGQPSQTVRCVLTADAVVHPDHRRRGLFEKITAVILEDLSNRDYEYVFALTSNQVSSANFQKLGWRPAHSMQMALGHAQRGSGFSVRGFARKLPLLPSVYRRLRSYANNRLVPSKDNYVPFGALDRTSARARPGTFAHVRVENAPRPDAMARLIERLGNDGRMRHVRDRQFFAWRFQNPLSMYRFMFWGDAELEGYLVLQAPVDLAESTWVNIVDWEAASIEARSDLLRASVEWGEFETLTVWSAGLPDKVKTLLVACGFHFLDEADSLERGLYCPSVLVRPVRHDMLQRDWVVADRSLLEMSNWDIRGIYADDY